MSWISNWKQKFEDYIVKKGIVKGAAAIAVFVIAKLGTAKVQAILAAAGVNVDIDQLQIYVTGVMVGALTFIYNFIKFHLVKKPTEPPK